MNKNDHDFKRLNRLTAIQNFLQTRRLVTATALAARFDVSTRTIYRDIRALEQSGVPIVTEDGKGYSLMEGYRLPPVMFTESQANALVLAEQLVLKNPDASFVKDYSEAIEKIKSILRQNVKDKANLLAQRTIFSHNQNEERSSHIVSDLQVALTNFNLVKIEYTNEANEPSTREIEPFALLGMTEKWLLVAWCRLRGDFRFFRLDRINKLEILAGQFAPHKMTLQEYFEKYH
ncbi:MAG: YafY family transcriptional regulator [Bacteroidales bacterium]|nr:YafY family transcriptional regulator [Bacteroidales bacterium]